MSTQQRTGWARQVLVVAGWIFAALAAAYVLIAHRVHALEWLPFVLLLVCPLMHIFMHGSHTRHPDTRHDSRER